MSRAALESEPGAPGELISFDRLWRAAVEQHRDRPFLLFADERGGVTTFSYGELESLVRAVAGRFRSAGVAPSSAVHLVMQSSVGMVAAWLACARLGAWMVPSDPRASVAELAGHLARTRPTVAVCDADRAGDYLQAIEAAHHRPIVLSLEADDVRARALLGPPVADAGSPSPAARLAVMFTSGTTAAPKGVELTQANYVFAARVMAASAGLTAADRAFVVLPLFHANAQYYSIAPAIAVGASVAMTARFSASQFVEQAHRLGVTHASLFAAPMRMILDRNPSPRRLALRHTWFAQNVTAQQYEAVSALLGCRPRQLYGMTETVPAVLSSPPAPSDGASLGTVTAGCHVRVLDEQGRPVRAGETGALQVGGYPGTTIFRGYLDDPATTARAFVERRADGFVWFDTGDRVRLDGRGQHWFAGRRGDLLKVAGENVSLVEVEAALAEHPDVAEVAVVGRPDPIRDEVPVAFVVPRDARAGLDPEALARWAASRLSPSKRPREIRVVAELPRTSVGKIKKFLLD